MTDSNNDKPSSSQATKITIEGIDTFLIVIAGEILRENPQISQPSEVLQIPLVANLEIAFQAVVLAREINDFPLPATTDDDFQTAHLQFRKLKSLLVIEDMIDLYCRLSD